MVSTQPDGRRGHVTITVDGNTWFDQDCSNITQDNVVDELVIDAARITFTADYPLDISGRIEGMTGTVINGLLTIDGKTIDGSPIAEPLPPFADGPTAS